MPKTASRLEHFTESVIREMTRIADEHGAINLAQGFPDFDPPEELIAAAARALYEGHNQYGLTWGTKNFREALARKQSRFMGLKIDPDLHVTATCGSTEAMIAALMAVCNPGDRVIVFSPVYENYIPDTILAGAEPIYIPLKPPNFRFDPRKLTDGFRKGAKAVVLCNPSNPTGKVFSREELRILAKMVRDHNAFVITDEVYEHIVYPPHQHRYIASLPGMFEHTISCGSLSKTYAITGWRLGYAIAAKGITEGIRKVHDFLTIGAPTPLQEAAVTALEFPESYYRDLRDAYTSRRDLFLDYLDRAGLDYIAPQGAYYVMVDVSAFEFDNDTDFCIWLAKEIGVAAVPGSSFYPGTSDHGRGASLIRLHFAKRDETLAEAGERLLKLREYTNNDQLRNVEQHH